MSLNKFLSEMVVCTIVLIAADSRLCASETRLIITSSAGRPEHLILTATDTTILWEYVTTIQPSNRSSKPEYHRGIVAGNAKQLVSAFDAVITHDVPSLVTEEEMPRIGISLLLIDGIHSRASRTLSYDQRRWLVEQSETKNILKDVKERKIFTKVNSMLELWIFGSDTLQTGEIIP